MNNTTQSPIFQNNLVIDPTLQMLDMQDEVTQNAISAKALLHSLSTNAHFANLDREVVMTMLNLCIDQIDKMNDLSAEMFELSKGGVMQ